MSTVDATQRNTGLLPIEGANARAADPQGATAGGSLLPAPAGSAVSSGADAGAAIAMMLIDSAFAQRKTAREAKAQAESAMVQAQKQQIDQLREAADDKYDAAMTDAWVQIGTGAATFAAVAVSSAEKGAGSNTTAEVGRLASAGTDFAKGAGTLASSAERHRSDNEDANAKQFEHAASLMKTIGEDWASDESAAKETARKALDFMKEYQSAQQQTQAAALHRA